MNYAKETERIMESEQGKKKSLLLHSCCAPCSSAVLMLLRKTFLVTVFYYNPNITEQNEYNVRVAEQKRLIQQMNEENSEDGQPIGYPISFIEGKYCPETFFCVTKGLEKVPEGGVRCQQCFALRLDKTAQVAKELKFDYFTTTLTISPLKDAEYLNRLGLKMQEKYQVDYLLSDFKKKDGYLKSIELSRKYDLYRQNYCGCVFSKQEN